MIESGPSSPVVTSAEGVPTLSTPPETTGRYIIVFADDVDPASVLQEAGLDDVTSSRELAGEEGAVSTTDTVFEELGMAVVSVEPGQLGALESSEEGPRRVLSVSPELIHHVRGDDYVRGYADGVHDLATRLGVTPTPPAGGPGAEAAGEVQFFRDTTDFTWGIQATRANVSPYSGQGISVAVLDTGFDSAHPDFVGRSVTTQSFIPNESPQDGHGHGTHCIGTSCGPKTPTTGPRYGVAYGATIFAGKVLSNSGSGSDGGILAGIDWAIANGCQVISMSLGADVPQVHPPYTAAGKRALDKGSLIIAAAGNNADRVNLNFGFVGPPANSPYIVAVAALDQQLNPAFFSARTLVTANGGQVDVAGPGHLVYSSWPMPTQYRTISGTSMATPHVAGLAALWAEATGFRGNELWSLLMQNGRRLMAPSLDVGSGLVLAP